ncbi:phytanoyl-CoA dioxygenase family protein [Paenibacillus spongiae]|uniref:Phytanoyl-CoA dioxygenase family protein n=1 Tax=Paenibacillus spongiae TaxID=2909671 RepID=A0ABY5SBF2_9BACL|nr:phytanoyl-CoA dioxygenase family protein [Paenibacillus spongiae]UVI30085.1 phytanoyl-CoA dioxygenase family protein [Paenibacillus spongiae]
MSTPLTDNDKKPIASELRDATPLLDDPEALRAQASADGYLYFRGFLEREEVMNVRKEILEIISRDGLLDPAHPFMEGMTLPEEVHRYTQEEISWNGVGVPMHLYHEVQKLESFHALAHHPRLIAMYRTLFGETPFVHPRNIGRIMLPHQDQKVTPSHQDFLHIQGADNTWTCWMPIGDIPKSLGGLTVLKGSRQAGLLGVTEAPGAGGLESILCGLNYEWQTCDYQAGDILTFHSHTVHKSTPNHIPNQLRLSCDYRYQPLSAPIENNSLLPHGPYAWDELYEGWSRTDLQFYWQKETFDFKPFDVSIRWQQEKIC